MGKGKGSKQVPVHAGIGGDLRKLYKKFKEFDSARLRDFQAAYEAVNMREIWFGRHSAADLLEYSERLLQMSVSYMFSSHTIVEEGAESVIVEHSLLERVFGIYCCFSYYFLQPQDYKARIPITPADYTDLQDFIRDTLVPERHVDTVACVLKLTNAGAFRLHPFRHAYDPSSHKRYDLPDVGDDIGEEREAPFAELTQLSKDPLLKKLALVHKKYEDVKTHWAPAVRSGKDALDEIQGIITKVKEDAAIQQMSTDARIKEDNDWTEEAQLAAEEQSLKNRLKDKAYTAEIKHNNRRYDPNSQIARIPLRLRREYARERKRELDSELFHRYELEQDDEDEDCVVLADNIEAMKDRLANLEPVAELVLPPERVAAEEAKTIAAKEPKEEPLDEFSEPMAMPQPDDNPLPMDSDNAETKNLESEMSQLVGEGVAKK